MGKTIRDAYGEALLKYGKDNRQVVVLDADVSGSTKSSIFGKEVPERFLNVGIAESNMVSMAAGLSYGDMIPFVNTFAIFIVTNGLIATRELIAYNKLNVKLMGAYGGLSDAYDGPTHHAIEDIAIMRSLPNMVVMCPCDEYQMAWMVKEAIRYKGPMYIRLSRNDMPTVYSENEMFEIGKGTVLQTGKDAVIFACGLMVGFAIEAAKQLKSKNIDVTVIDLFSIKPIDEALVLQYAKETHAVITAEEHSIIGGLGSAISEVIVKNQIAVAFEMVGLRDRFAECGPYDALLKKYHMHVNDIIDAVEKAIERK